MRRPHRKIQPVGQGRPYTVTEIRRQKCSVAGCDRSAVHQWQCCATGNRWMPLCLEHDIELNRRVLQWVGHPDADTLMRRYDGRV